MTTRFAFNVDTDSATIRAEVPIATLREWPKERFDRFFEAAGTLLDVIHGPAWLDPDPPDPPEPRAIARDRAPTGLAPPPATNGHHPPPDLGKARDAAASIARLRVIEFLHTHGGAIRDPGGFVVRGLARDLGYESTNGLTALLKAMEDDGLVEREIRGKRTFGLHLEPAGLDLLDLGDDPEAEPPERQPLDHDAIRARAAEGF